MSSFPPSVPPSSPELAPVQSASSKPLNYGTAILMDGMSNGAKADVLHRTFWNPPASGDAAASSPVHALTLGVHAPDKVAILAAHMGGMGYTRTTEQQQLLDATVDAAQQRAALRAHPLMDIAQNTEWCEEIETENARNASASPQPVFDVIIGWNPLVEEIVAADCYGAPEGFTLLAMKPHGKVFKPEHLALCKGKRVLVCGSYFGIDQFHRLLDGGATSVLNWVYSDADLVALADPNFSRSIESGMLSGGPFHIDTDRFPRATRLIRRALYPRSEHAEEDEAFYRGLMHHAFDQGYTHEGAIVAWLRNAHDFSLDERDLIETGITLSCEHDNVAADIVKGAVRVGKDFDGHLPEEHRPAIENSITINVVVSGSALIMPVAKALAEEADVGVVIRYNLAQSTTSLTFYTEDGTDLSWVETAPWNGGGKPDCKDTTLSLLIPIQTLLVWLQQAPPAAAHMPCAPLD